jgi:DMSO/TMAO reductase YedYZ molybdopterin-dependent catalytic subunit
MRTVLRFLIIVAIAVLVASPVLILRAEKASTITPNDEFFEVYYSYQPEIDAEEWNLTVTGMVEDPVVIGYNDLLQLEGTTAVVTLTCVTGGTGTAEWTGVRLTDLLGAAGVSDDAQEVVFYCADGYSTSLTMEEIEEDVILAWEMNGAPLPMEQGYPLRVVAPNQYGYKWAMWLVAVEAIDTDHQGYWESRGWSDDATISIERDWWAHSFLFVLGGVFGLFAGISGRYPSGKGFLDGDVHRFSAAAYTMALTLTLIYWAWTTMDLRGDVFYSIHGRMALGAFLANAVGIALSPLRKRSKALASVHCSASGISLLLFLVAILTGISLAMR